ncbi:hypothetical protein [Maribacter sp.]|uniref:hypothetical protein n=1 Tax=Maribacter sp. TaxID=1897614 RepID=UPI0025C34E4B|nr:hypothetical protein [Maribacter sp.]
MLEKENKDFRYLKYIWDAGDIQGFVSNYDFLLKEFIKDYPKASEHNFLNYQLQKFKNLKALRENSLIGNDEIIKNANHLVKSEKDKNTLSNYEAKLDEANKMHQNYLFDAENGIEWIEQKIKGEGLPEVEKDNNKISLPHQIALLNEIGFFELDYFKNATQTKRNKIISKLLNADLRGVRGNIKTLDPNTTENIFRFTSYKHIDEVKNYLNKL